MPVGRSLAFDAARGRLWVICPRCQRWNLSPLDERWEAIAQCEREFRDAPLRASTAQIGLVRTRDGLQLVRIGQPTRPEMATWRYARVFQQRRRHAYITAAAIGVVGMGVISVNQLSPALYAAIPAIGSLPALTNVWHVYREFVKPVARVYDADGNETVLRGQDITSVYLAPDRDADGWMLRVARKRGELFLRGADATSTLGRLLAFSNRVGAQEAVVMNAAERLIAAGSAAAYLRSAAARSSHDTASPLDRQHATVESRLALEMALHEATEHLADDGDLTALHEAWRNAESLAAIADQLTLPTWVGGRLRGLRAVE
ncbi:MAG: hypothetical protein IT353_09685 [Gemmatimonadaceae bacterium]|nr:hypothetical protein [Gemmatimonadaceae bacterium]